MKFSINRARLSVLSLACISAVSAHAQSDHVSSLREVVVVASRFEESKLDVPMSVQVISKDEIQRSAAMSVPDVLHTLDRKSVV